MYITEVLTKTTTGKVAHRCILLRESYREDGKVKTRTLANVTHCPPEDIAALRWALHHQEVFVSPDASARLLERLATNTLDTEDRALLGCVLQISPRHRGGRSSPAHQLLARPPHAHGGQCPQRGDVREHEEKGGALGAPVLPQPLALGIHW